MCLWHFSHSSSLFRVTVFFLYLKKLFYLFLAVPDFHYRLGFSLVVASGDYYLVWEHGFFTVVVSLGAEHKLSSWGKARGVFLDQDSNLCLLHGQAEFLPLSHLRSPCSFILAHYSSSSSGNRTSLGFRDERTEWLPSTWRLSHLLRIQTLLRHCAIRWEGNKPLFCLKRGNSESLYYGD